MAEDSATPFDSGGKKKARIEIIPLIDVIFFLLATFVLFTLSLNKIQSMEAKLPVTSPDTTKNIDKEEPLTLQVSDGSTVFIQRDPADITEVLPRIVQYRQTQEQNGKPARVLISGDDRAKYGSLIKVLDMAKTAGITEISFETAYRASGK